MNIPKTIGRYVVTKELGRGGMAIVYLAEDPLTERRVAIKLLPRQLAFDPMFRRRFQQEAKVIARLEHPAIVPLYDFGEINEQPYLVMRYMAGGSLGDRGKRPFSLPEIAQLFQRIGPALDKSHQQNIVHRDLKPDNILFDEEGQPYLSDFGIARLTEATQTMTIAGTPAYMSPEQVKGDRALDGRCDIYALGAILFELLTGRPPYEADTPTKLMMKHILEPVPFVLSYREDLPVESQAVVAKALAKEREERYTTATAFAEAVLQLATTTLTPTETAVSPTKPKTTSPPEPEPTLVLPQTVAQPAKTSAPSPTPTEPAAKKGIPAFVWGIVGLAAIALLLVVWFQSGGDEPPTEEQTDTSLTTETTDTNTATTTNVSDAAEAATTEAEPIPVAEPADSSQADANGMATNDFSIGLGDTQFSELEAGGQAIWTYTGETAVVDMTITGHSENNHVLLIFPPDSNEPEQYSDFLPQGGGEFIAFYTLEPGYQLLIEDTQQTGGLYSLTIEQARPQTLFLGDTIEGQLIGANPAIFTFRDAPANVDITLTLDDKDLGLVIVYDAEKGSPHNWLYYEEAIGTVEMKNVTLEAGTYQIFVRDTANDGADFQLTVTEVDS